jgi:hypothetical protein
VLNHMMYEYSNHTALKGSNIRMQDYYSEFMVLFDISNKYFKVAPNKFLFCVRYNTQRSEQILEAKRNKHVRYCVCQYNDSSPSVGGNITSYRNVMYIKYTVNSGQC